MADYQPKSAARKNRLIRAATKEFTKLQAEPLQQASEKPQQRDKPQEREFRKADQSPVRPATPERRKAQYRPSGSASFTPLRFADGDDSDTTSDFADIMIGKHHHRHSSGHMPEEVEETEFLTTAPWFKNFVAGIIVANTIVMIVEAFLIQLQSQVFTYFDWIFTALYVCELSCCVAEQGIKKYLCEDEEWWNCFDMFVTVACVLDLVVSTVSGASITRLFRLFRILRMCRGLRFLSEMDYVLIQIARATLKLGLLASLMLFVSSMVATNMLWDCVDPVVAGMFEDLGKSLWTMFKIMTLDNWIASVDIVLEVKPEMIWFFLIFIFSTAISLISLAPAMFIDISLKQMEHEDFKQQELARSALRAQKKKILSTLFKLTDMDNSGSISVDELKTVLCNDSFVNELEKRGISRADDLRDVRLGLFDLWEEKLNNAKGDHDDITMEEFTDGLLRMHEEFSQAVLWRSITSTRLLLRDFAAVVLDELADMRTDMSSNINQAVSGLMHSLEESRGSISSGGNGNQHSQEANEKLQTSSASSHRTPAQRFRLQRNSTQIFTRRTTFEKEIGLRDGALKTKFTSPTDDSDSSSEWDHRRNPSDRLTQRLTQRLDTLIRRREVPISLNSATLDAYQSDGSEFGREANTMASRNSSRSSSSALLDGMISRDMSRTLQFDESGLKCKL